MLFSGMRREGRRVAHLLAAAAVLGAFSGAAYGQFSAEYASLSASQGQFPMGPQSFEPTARQVFISGRIMIEDGSAPEQIAAIQSRCVRRIQVEGYTNRKGQFQLSLPNRVPQEDSPLNYAGRSKNAGLMDQPLGACELQVVLPGYYAAPVPLIHYAHANSANLGVVVMHRLGSAEGIVVSATTLQAPKAARSALEKGQQAARRQNWSKASEELHKAVALYPEFSLAWCELGKAQQASHDLEAAEASFLQSIRTDTHFLEPNLALINLYLDQKRWPELARATENTLRLDPYGYPSAYMLNAYANLYTGHWDAAEKSALAAARLDANHADQAMALATEAREHRNAQTAKASTLAPGKTIVTMEEAELARRP